VVALIVSASPWEILGTHRFQRAVSEEDAFIGIRPEYASLPVRGRLNSDQPAFRRDCTLEAMRTQARFSLFLGVVTNDVTDSLDTSIIDRVHCEGAKVAQVRRLDKRERLLILPPRKSIACIAG
jgi:hypothetical protein